MLELEINPILLSCRIVGESLEVLYKDQLVSGDGVRVTLDDGTSTSLRIADFTQDKICYRAQASTVSNGMLVQWDREEIGVRSPELKADATAEQHLSVQVQAVAYDDENASARESADYTPAIYNNTIDVWIPKKGSKPT